MRKGIHLKNFFPLLIRRDYRNEIFATLTHFALRKWRHDDAETSAFNVNIRLFVFQEIIFDQDYYYCYYYYYYYYYYYCYSYSYYYLNSFEV